MANPAGPNGQPCDSRSDKLFRRDFVLLWQGLLVSNLGSQAFLIAAMVYLQETAKSATAMAGFMALSLIAQGLASPVGGAVADRARRRTVLVVSDLVSGIAVFVLAGVMFFTRDPAYVTPVLAFVFVVGGFAGAFFMPASRAMLPSLVSPANLATANALSEGTMQVATLAGQAIAGTALRLLGAPVLFLVDAVSYVLSALSEVFIREPRTPERTGRADAGGIRWRDVPTVLGADVRDGAVAVAGHPGVRNLLIMAALISLIAMPFVVLLPFYVSGHLNAGTDWFGFLLAAFGGGALLGYGAASPVPWRGRHVAPVLLSGLAVMSLSLVSLGVFHSAAAALLAMVVAGAGQGVFQVGAMTVFQTSVEDASRARVFGLLQSVVSLLGPVSLVLTGAVVDAMGQNAARMFMICGALMLGVCVWGASNTPIRRFLSGEAPLGDIATPPPDPES